MFADSHLRAIMPALPAAKLELFLPFLQSATTEFAIDRPAREAAFIAQLAHESVQLRFMEEIWGPTEAQKRYEPPSTLATKLGNTEKGDGKRFKGRGPIQITGRGNYQRYGELLSLDLVTDPPKAAAPEVGFRTAGVYWQKNGLNELADLATPEAFREITKRINGGLNGIKDRERFYATARTVLGVDTPQPTAGPESLPIPHTPFARGFEAIRADARRRRRAR
jgi:predicted chitinase